MRISIRTCTTVSRRCRHDRIRQLVHHGLICAAASEAPYAGGITEALATALLLEDAGFVEHLVTVPLILMLLQDPDDLLFRVPVLLHAP
jgi:hypothetical protein